MARSLRSKRRLRNVRIQVEKLAPYNKKVLDEIIEKREEHFKSQGVDAENLNIPPELRALNNNKNSMIVEEKKSSKKQQQQKESNEMVDDNDNSEDEDEDMEDATKVKKSATPYVHLSHKENKTKYAKLYIKRQIAKKNTKKVKPII